MEDAQTFGARIRNARIGAGITLHNAAQQAAVHDNTWRRWEQGTTKPLPMRLGEIANALQIPVVSLFAPPGYLAVADVVLSPQAVARVRREGRPAAAELAQTLASQLEPLIHAAATRPKVDVSPGARAKPRRSRRQILAQTKQASQMRAAAQARRRAELG